jgi:hypothetical protein
MNHVIPQAQLSAYIIKTTFILRQDKYIACRVQFCEGQTECDNLINKCQLPDRLRSYLVYTVKTLIRAPSNTTRHLFIIFFLKDPIYLQSVTIHSANGGKGEGWHVEEYSLALLC